MSIFDFKTATPDTSITDAQFFFGADSQSDATPKIYQNIAFRTLLLGTSTSTLAIAAGKTLTASNTLTFAGTDSTVMTFPTTSATIARTDAANTFTGASTATSWNLVTPVLGAATGTSLTISAQIWSGSVTSALSGLTGATDGFRSSASNVTGIASENVTASSSTQGAFVGVYSNDGAALASGDRLGGIRMGGSSSAAAIRNSALIAGFADQTWVDASAYGSRLEFQTTTNNATTPTTKAAIGNDGVMTVAASTATPAGGSTAARLLFGTTAGFGIYYGSGAPSSLTAAQGSLYLRSDGSGIADRLYVNTTGSTTWTNFVSAA